MIKCKFVTKHSTWGKVLFVVRSFHQVGNTAVQCHPINCFKHSLISVSAGPTLYFFSGDIRESYKPNDICKVQ